MTTVNNSPDKNSTTQTLQAPPVCTEDDIYYFREGTNNRLYRWLGAHPCTHATQEGGKPEKGCWFAVWAPNAREVQVIGDFNGWQHGASPLAVRGDSSGIWEGFVPHASVGDCYKYHILSAPTGEWLEKSDPFGFAWEEPPCTATRIADISYRWDDAEWMKTRGQANALNAPHQHLRMPPGLLDAPGRQPARLPQLPRHRAQAGRPRTIPLIIMASVSWGISFDVRNLKFAVYDRDQTAASRELVEYFDGSRYFLQQPPIQSEAEIDTVLKSSGAILVIDIPSGFGRDLARGLKPEVGFYVDGSMPFNATNIRGYIGSLITAYTKDRIAESGLPVSLKAPAGIEPRFMYNQDFDSINAIAPRQGRV